MPERRPRNDYGGRVETHEERQEALRVAWENGFGCSSCYAPEQPRKGSLVPVVTDGFTVTDTEIGDDGVERTVVHEFAFKEGRFVDAEALDGALGYLAAGSAGETPEQ